MLNKGAEVKLMTDGSGEVQLCGVMEEVNRLASIARVSSLGLQSVFRGLRWDCGVSRRSMTPRTWSS